jgi:uridine kinase
MLKDLKILLQRKPVALPIYDYKTSERTKKTQIIKPVDVVIFEGILSLYDHKVNDLANIKIFVDTPADERFIRRLVRDKKERARTDDDIIGQWRNTVRVMHEQFISPLKTQADIIVPWYHMNQIAIDAIKGAIESIYHKK